VLSGWMHRWTQSVDACWTLTTTGDWMHAMAGKWLHTHRRRLEVQPPPMRTARWMHVTADAKNSRLALARSAPAHNSIPDGGGSQQRSKAAKSL